MNNYNLKLKLLVGPFIFAILWIVVIFGIAAACACLLVPYVIETWAMWLHRVAVIEWWKGLAIFFGLVIFTRQSAVYTVLVAALITWLFSISGFQGI